MAEMGELYGVSESEIEIQIKAHKYLFDQLKKSYFTGNHFYPKHQDKVFNALGEPTIKEEPKKTPPLVIKGGCFWHRWKLRRLIKANRSK